MEVITFFQILRFCFISEYKVQRMYRPIIQYTPQIIIFKSAYLAQCDHQKVLKDRDEGTSLEKRKEVYGDSRAKVS